MEINSSILLLFLRCFRDSWLHSNFLLVRSLIFFILRRSRAGEYSRGQLQALRRLLSALKFLLRTFRDGFWKKLRPLGDFTSFVLLLLLLLLVCVFVAGNESEDEYMESFCGLFSAWFIRASHFTAGSLSSITRTFPALSGTIS